MATLDQQEGVPSVYNRKTVEVEAEGGTVEAYTYFLVKPLEQDTRPSAVYLDVIVRGALENKLPQVSLVGSACNTVHTFRSMWSV